MADLATRNKQTQNKAGFRGRATKLPAAVAPLPPYGPEGLSVAPEVSKSFGGGFFASTKMSFAAGVLAVAIAVPPVIIFAANRLFPERTTSGVKVTCPPSREKYFILEFHKGPLPLGQMEQSASNVLYVRLDSAENVSKSYMAARNLIDKYTYYSRVENTHENKETVWVAAAFDPMFKIKLATTTPNLLVYPEPEDGDFNIEDYQKVALASRKIICNFLNGAGANVIRIVISSNNEIDKGRLFAMSKS